MTNSGTGRYPVLLSFIEGARLMRAHGRIVLGLSFVPFALTLVTLVGLRLLGDNASVFWLPVLQWPSSFVVGLECALLLRFFLLGEFPVTARGVSEQRRNRSLFTAGFAYAAVTYFMTGAYAVMLHLNTLMQNDPERAAPYMPLALAIVIGMAWGARFLWLMMPLALDWPVRGFFARIGGWAGSLRIFALFGLCSLTLNIVTAFFRIFVHGVVGAAHSGLAAALDDAVVAAATLILAILFTCASAAAIKTISQEKTT